MKGEHETTLTEHLLQRAGMSPENSFLINNISSTLFTMGGTLYVYSARMHYLFESQMLSTNSQNFSVTNVNQGCSGSITGRRGWELRHPNFQNTGRHTATKIQNTTYSSHALDQMQNRGFVPSVVENTIKKGCIFPTKTNTIGYYDSINNVRVIVNSKSGKVVTVIPGAPK